MNMELSKIQRYLEWFKTKLQLDCIASSAKEKYIMRVKRGEVYYCDFGVGVGSEQEKSNRPCVILQNYNGNRNSPNTIVAPITHSSSILSVVVPIATQYRNIKSILLDGNVLLGNIVTISKARLGDFITILPPIEMAAVDKALALSVELYKYQKDLEDKLSDKLNYIKIIKTARNEAQDNLKKIYTLLSVKSIEEANEKIGVLLDNGGQAHI